MAEHDETARQQEPDAEGNKVVDVVAGPYRGQRLKMPAGEADQAILDYWARDPFEAALPPEPATGEPPGPPFLSDEERKAAYEAAQAWAQAQWDAAQQLETEDMRQVREARGPSSAEGGSAETRAMAPGQPGEYQVRRGPGRPPGSTTRRE